MSFSCDFHVVFTVVILHNFTNIFCNNCGFFMNNELNFNNFTPDDPPGQQRGPQQIEADIIAIIPSNKARPIIKPFIECLAL